MASPLVVVVEPLAVLLPQRRQRPSDATSVQGRHGTEFPIARRSCSRSVAFLPVRGPSHASEVATPDMLGRGETITACCHHAPGPTTRIVRRTIEYLDAYPCRPAEQPEKAIRAGACAARHTLGRPQ